MHELLNACSADDYQGYDEEKGGSEMIYEFEGKTERDAIDKAIAELGLEAD